MGLEKNEYTENNEHCNISIDKSIWKILNITYFYSRYINVK
jgi:hypothetical protein